jgi:hypothetical protein
MLTRRRGRVYTFLAAVKSQRERTTNMSDWVYDMGADDHRTEEQLCPVCEDDMGQTLCGGCEAEGWRRCPCCGDWRREFTVGRWACGCDDEEATCPRCAEECAEDDCPECRCKKDRPQWPECDPEPKHKREEALP